MAQELRHHFGLAHACNLYAVVHHLRGEPALAEESADIGLGVAREQRIAIELGRATILKGWGLVARSQTEQGLSLMLEGLAEYQATAAQVWQPYYVSLVAETYGKAGQVEKGLALLADALTFLAKPGEGWWEAELHRLTGELRLLRDTSAATVAEAQVSFEHALAIASGSRRSRSSCGPR